MQALQIIAITGLKSWVVLIIQEKIAFNFMKR